ncbi:MAG: EAL domain-containing protein [Alphaproteobacteria bacterium]|nr:EAL domain-containing protein [Alphaproteobacteria bacterium]
MDTIPTREQIILAIRRLVPPIICGLLCILVTIVIYNIPRTYFSLALSCFFSIFIITHALWLHKALQALRQDIKESIKSSKPAQSPPTQLAPREEQHTHDIMIEATFFQKLRERLNIPHAIYIQAQSLQNDKTQLFLTDGLIPLLRDNQLEILTQPIVSLPQKRLSFFYCVPCVTLESGALINLNTLSSSAAELPSLQALERMILFQTLQFVRRHHVTHPNHGFVCHLSPLIYKDTHCLEEICDFLHKSHFPFQGLIFDVSVDISESALQNLLQLSHFGVRFMGNYLQKSLPENLSELMIPSVDFITLPYGELLKWLKKYPRRQSLESLQQVFEASPQIIVSQVSQEQELYHNLPLPFDFASGKAFGLAKPFYHIQA